MPKFTGETTVEGNLIVDGDMTLSDVTINNLSVTNQINYGTNANARELLLYHDPNANHNYGFGI